MKLKLMFYTASQADLERVLSMCLTIDSSHEIHIFSSTDTFRMEDPKLWGIIRRRGIHFFDLSQMQLWAYLARVWNLMAREHQSESYFLMSQFARKLSIDTQTDCILRYLDEIQADALISSYFFENHGSIFYEAFYDWFEKRSNPIYFIPHAIALNDEYLEGVCDLVEPMLNARAYIFPNEFESNYRLRNTKTNSAQKWVIGDPALSPNWVQREDVELDFDCAVFLPGGFFPVFRDIDWIAWFEEFLRQNQDQKIALKLHPNSSSAHIYQHFQARENLKVFWRELNGVDLIQRSQRIITTPSTVIFQAMLLDKPLMVIDYFHPLINRVMLENLDVLTLDVEDRSELNSNRCVPMQNQNYLIQNAWGSVEDCPAKRVSERIIQDILQLKGM